MILTKAAHCLLGASVQVELPRPNMVLDPRPNYPRECKFECVYTYNSNMTIVTLTRLDEVYLWDEKKIEEGEEEDDWVLRFRDDFEFEFRVYDPTVEAVPWFESTIYTYLGLDGERAPYNTTVLIIDSSVKIIKGYAFYGCHSIKKCFMCDDGVHTIEEEAFSGCWDMEAIGLSRTLKHIGKFAFQECRSLKKCFMYDGVEIIDRGAFLDCWDIKVVRLSRTLKHIGEKAFNGCRSLDAIFLPPSLKKIDTWAFRKCFFVTILPLPQSIDISRLWKVLERCDNLFRTAQVKDYKRSHNDEVHQSILNFYRHLPPLHQICLDTSVNAQGIYECIDLHGPPTASTADHGITPLHILAMNPHADIAAIHACFDANMGAAFVRDKNFRKNTPLDYLREHHDIEIHTSLVAALCMGRDKMMD